MKADTMINSKYEKYPAYKDSGVEWLGEIPEEWEVKRLNSCFKERRVKVSDKEYQPLSVTKNGILPQLENAAKSNDGDNRKLVKKGDFVINSRSDRKGSSGLSELDGSVSLINIVIKPLLLNPYFSSFLLKSYPFIEEYYRNGHGIVADLWTTRYDEMANIIVPVPSFPEQTRIAEFLDSKTALVDKAITQKEKQIELLKERKQIIIQNAVTKGLNPNVKLKDSGVEWIGEIPEHWDVKRLKYICYINRLSLEEDTSNDFEFNYVDIGSVTYESGITKTENYRFKNAPSRARRIASNGDTIVSTVRTYLKAIDFIENAKENYIYSTGFAILTPNLRQTLPRYLTIIIRSDFFTNQVEVNSKGMSYPAINSTELGRLHLLLPPTQEQKAIVEYIEKSNSKIDKAIDQQQKQIEKLKEYKTVLIDSAVTGKIKV